jgi:predicted nucleotidyltransferase component of viral defense system
MLHTDAVDGSTLELLTLLQSKEYLKGFHLIGGTALALYLGHRRSVDIDLFSNFGFDVTQMLENINHDFPFQLFYSSINTLRGSIWNVKTDIIAHRYPYIKEPVISDTFSVLSEEDIIAMKLNAIMTSGQRIKDFIDIYFLLDKYNIADMVKFYKAKYNQENDGLILKSLIYFDDVDNSDWPILIKNPGLKWGIIKKRINDAVLSYVRK